MHTFTKLPVIRPIKIQMHASKYGTKSPDQTEYVELFLRQNRWRTSGKWRNWESPFLEDPVNL